MEWLHGMALLPIPASGWGSLKQTWCCWRGEGLPRSLPWRVTTHHWHVCCWSAPPAATSQELEWVDPWLCDVFNIPCRIHSKCPNVRAPTPGNLAWTFWQMPWEAGLFPHGPLLFSLLCLSLVVWWGKKITAFSPAWSGKGLWLEQCRKSFKQLRHVKHYFEKVLKYKK